MTSDEAVLAIIDVLEATSIPYMVVGSLSTNLYGIPRSTKDADFVVQLDPGDLQAIAPRFAPAFRFDPQVSFETVTGTTRYILDTVEGVFRVELFLLSDDPHDQERFRRRVRSRVLGRDTYVPTAEDVVITKLRWSRQGKRARDLEDTRGVLSVQRDSLDWDYVYHWCNQHGTRELLDELRRNLPEV